jgi:hypothetical protein
MLTKLRIGDLSKRPTFRASHLKRALRLVCSARPMPSKINCITFRIKADKSKNSPIEYTQGNALSSKNYI